MYPYHVSHWLQALGYEVRGIDLVGWPYGKLLEATNVSMVMVVLGDGFVCP
jgi:hypothetical protein